MIDKDGRINHLYLKSKSAFITFFRILIKLAEQVKIHLRYKFKIFMSKKKSLMMFFKNFLRHEPGTQKRGAESYDYDVILTISTFGGAQVEIILTISTILEVKINQF